MKKFSPKILAAVFEGDTYNEEAFEDSHYKALVTQFKIACDKFGTCLPEDLKMGFSAIRDLSIAVDLESRDVGKAIGLALAGDLWNLLLTPNEALEALTQTYIKPEQAYESDFQAIEASIANYLKSQKGVDK